MPFRFTDTSASVGLQGASDTLALAQELAQRQGLYEQRVKDSERAAQVDQLRLKLAQEGMQLDRERQDFSIGRQQAGDQAATAQLQGMVDQTEGTDALPPHLRERMVELLMTAKAGLNNGYLRKEDALRLLEEGAEEVQRDRIHDSMLDRVAKGQYGENEQAIEAITQLAEQLKEGQITPQQAGAAEIKVRQSMAEDEAEIAELQIAGQEAAEVVNSLAGVRQHLPPEVWAQVVKLPSMVAHGLIRPQDLAQHIRLLFQGGGARGGGGPQGLTQAQGLQVRRTAMQMAQDPELEINLPEIAKLPMDRRVAALEVMLGKPSVHDQPQEPMAAFTKGSPSAKEAGEAKETVPPFTQAPHRGHINATATPSGGGPEGGPKAYREWLRSQDNPAQAQLQLVETIAEAIVGGATAEQLEAIQAELGIPGTPSEAVKKAIRLRVQKLKAGRGREKAERRISPAGVK